MRKDVSSYAANGSISEEKPLYNVIIGYKGILKDGKYTTEYAADYFSIDSLSKPYDVKLKVFSAIPNILTSLGILGTFLGLSLALISFNSVDSEAIRNSINSLLAGMSTAFWTSVAGMSTSAIFLFCEKKLVNNTELDIDVLCSKLDAQFHRSADQVIIDSFTQKTEDGDIISPAESFNVIVESLKKMKTALEMFGTNLCDSIGNAIDTSFQNRLVPIIYELAEKLENPAQAVTDSLVKELAKVCNSFQNKLTERLNQELEELLERFIDASNAILNLPDIIEDLRKSVSSTIIEAVNAYNEIFTSLGEQILRLVDLSDSFAETTDKMTVSADKIESINKSLAQVPDVVNNASNAITSASNNLEQSNNSIKESYEKTYASVLVYTEKIQTIQNGLKEIFKDIDEGLTKYAEATKAGLQKMLDPFTTSISDATMKVANSIAPLNDAVDELSTFGDTITKSLKELSEAIVPFEKSIKRLQEINANETK